MFSETFFNETVKFVDENRLYDPDQVFTFVLMIAAVATVLFAGLKAFSSVFGGSSTKKSKKAAAKANKENTEFNHEEWLPATHSKKSKKKD